VLDLVVSTGLQVFEAMLEQDREALCGPKWKRVPARRPAPSWWRPSALARVSPRPRDPRRRRPGKKQAQRSKNAARAFSLPEPGFLV
jgi:hypothetical protein